jgi:uncharacterized damage-inducible protein DinB
MDWGGELRSPGFILLHVITHAFHHKGQIVTMLRIVGYPAPDIDLIDTNKQKRAKATRSCRTSASQRAVPLI